MPRIAAAVTVVIVMGMCIGFNTVRYPAVWKMVAAAHQAPGPDQPAPQLQSFTSSGPQPAEGPAAGMGLIADSADSSFSSAGVDPIPFPARLNSGGDDWSDETPASEDDDSVAASMPGDPTRSYAYDDDRNGDAAPEPPLEPVNPYLASSSPRDRGYDERASEPVEVAPALKYASGATEMVEPDLSTLDDRFAGAKRQPLVPVGSADRHPYQGPTAGESPAAESGVRRPNTDKLDNRVERLPPVDKTSDPPRVGGEFTGSDGPVPIYPSTQDY